MILWEPQQKRNLFCEMLLYLTLRGLVDLAPPGNESPRDTNKIRRRRAESLP